MTSSTTDRRLGLTSGVAIKTPVAVATTANITLSGEQTIDGVTTSASRVLVKNQTTASQNGIYDTSSAAWTRAVDANGNSDLQTGTLVYVTGGTSLAGTFYSVTTANPIVVGTSSITWAMSVLGTAMPSIGRVLQGADPTGVADDTALFRALFDITIPAMQKAILPAGAYRVTGPITDPATIASGALYIECTGPVTITVDATSTAFTSLLNCYTTAINNCTITGGRLTLALNNKCANGIYLRHAGGDGGSIDIGPVTVTNAKNTDAASTAENNGILVYGRYTSVRITDSIVDGVSRANTAGGACKGISVNDLMGQCTIDSPQVSRVLCTGATADADGISIFGYQLNGVYGHRGGSAQVNNAVFVDCQGRSFKAQIDECVLYRPRCYHKDVVTINEKDIDFQAGSGTLIEPFFEYRKNGGTSPLGGTFYPISIQQQSTDRPNRFVSRGGVLKTEVAISRVAYLTVGATALDGEVTVEDMELQPLGSLATSIVTRAFLETHAGQIAASTGATHVSLIGNRGNMSGYPLLGYTNYAASVATKLSFDVRDNVNSGASAAGSKVVAEVSGSPIPQFRDFFMSGNIGFLDTLAGITFSFATLAVGCRFHTDIATTTATNAPSWGSTGSAFIEVLGQVSATQRTVRVTVENAATGNTEFHTISGGTAWGTLNAAPASVDQSAGRALNTTYTNGTRARLVLATVRCAITLAGGTAYVQGKSDASAPPTTIATGLVGVQAGLLNEDNSYQVSFLVAPGMNYRIDSTAVNGTATLGKWFEITY